MDRSLLPTDVEQTLVDTDSVRPPSYTDSPDRKDSLRSEAEDQLQAQPVLVDDYFMLQPVMIRDDPSGGSNRRTQPGSIQDQSRVPQSKRPHQIASYGGKDLAPSSGEPSTKRTRSDDRRPRTQYFPCPFFKRDPNKYCGCLPFRLTRIKDVKQHLYRKHSKSNSYCPRCWLTFDTTDERDRHARSASCTLRSDALFDGITDQQKRLFRNYGSRGKPVEDQWFEIWDILFPGLPRPVSPYAGNNMEEAVSSVQVFWNGSRDDVMASVIRTGQFPGVDQDILRRAVESSFNRLFRLAGAADADCNTASTISDDESEATADFCNYPVRQLTPKSSCRDTPIAALPQVMALSPPPSSYFQDLPIFEDLFWDNTFGQVNLELSEFIDSGIPGVGVIGESNTKTLAWKET